MLDTLTHDGKPVHLQVTDLLSVTIIPHDGHDWLMTTAEVAFGYDVGPRYVRKLKDNGEFVEGTHFVKGGTISSTLANNLQPHQTLWTKLGVIRLGMHIRSERAKLFRDWAELILLCVLEPQPQAATITATAPILASLPPAPRRKDNRLTPARLVDLLSTVALVEDAALRRSLVEQLNPSAEAVQLKLTHKGAGHAK